MQQDDILTEAGRRSQSESPHMAVKRRRPVPLVLIASEPADRRDLALSGCLHAHAACEPLPALLMSTMETGIPRSLLDAI